MAIGTRIAIEGVYSNYKNKKNQTMNLISVKPARRRSFYPASFNNEFDQIFESFFRNDFPTTHSTNRKGVLSPKVNVIEGKDDFRLEVALPGLDRSDITVNVDKGLLQITAKKEYETAENETIRKREFGSYSYSRSFRLNDKVDANTIAATFTNGVLTVTLPKKEEAKDKEPRKIEIA